MTTALQIINDAYERMNRLSPGETLSADDAGFGLTRLNLLLDGLSARPRFLFKTSITTATQTGHITLGAGSWAAVSPGATISSVTVDDRQIDPLSMPRYHAIQSPTVTGSPSLYAFDGLSTIYLYPVPNGQEISIAQLVTASQFADLTTEYTLPAGYKDFLGAKLAVRLARTVIGKVPIELEREAREAEGSLPGYMPQILDAYGYTQPRGASILDG